jgi:hypothetical protein
LLRDKIQSFKVWLAIRLTEESVGLSSPSISTETKVDVTTYSSSIKIPVSFQERSSMGAALWQGQQMVG